MLVCCRKERRSGEKMGKKEQENSLARREKVFVKQKKFKKIWKVFSSSFFSLSLTHSPFIQFVLTTFCLQNCSLNSADCLSLACCCSSFPAPQTSSGKFAARTTESNWQTSSQKHSFVVRRRAALAKRAAKGAKTVFHLLATLFASLKLHLEPPMLRPRSK